MQAAAADDSRFPTVAVATTPDSFDTSMAAAELMSALTMVSSAIFTDVTAESAIFAVVTAPSARSPATIVASAIFAEVTAEAAIFAVVTAPSAATAATSVLTSSASFFRSPGTSVAEASPG